MFKFDEYPTIKDMHKKYLKHDYSSIRALIRVVDKKAKGAEAKFDKAMDKSKVFELLYERTIFDALVKIKPNLLNRRTDSYETWDSTIGDDFDKIPDNEKVRLLLLVEENGGIYRLPNDYYV